MNNKPDHDEEKNRLKDIISEQKKSLHTKEKRIRILEEYILSLQQKQFGSSGEQQEAIQSELMFTEAEDSAEAEVPEQVDAFGGEPVIVAGHKRKKKRIAIPAELPRVEIIHDLPANQKCCPHDGTELKPIGFESHEQLDVIPASVRVLHHRHLKYACPCCEKHIVTAKKPAQPIEKSIASSGLLAHIAIKKYADALPLYRQGKIFKRIGVELDTTTLANWMIRSGTLVQPLINLFHEKILEQPVLHTDETRVQVLRW